VFITVSEMSRFWNIKPSGVLHVGAHLAEETSSYEKHGWVPVIWVEAQPNLVEILKSNLDFPHHKVIEGAIWDEDGVKLKLHIASSSQSTSLLDLGTHAKLYPDITYISDIDVVTKRLDSLIKSNEMPNFINLDIQGVELRAIKSLGRLIELVEYIYVEVNKKMVYEGCTDIRELDDFLFDCGFTRKCTRWYLQEGWGDALYIRSTTVKDRNFLQMIQSSVIHSTFYFRQFLTIGKKYLRSN
jgi:FkbM family methyltransferase